MSEVKISADLRTEFGKGGARRTRRAGKVPAVLYGHGEKPRHIALPARDFAAAMRHGGMTQTFTIEISDGTSVLALPKAIQRDPIKDTIDHVDLLLVGRDEKVTVEVPLQLVGTPASGTLLVTEHSTLAVLALASSLPDHVEVSVAGLQAGANVTAGDVVLPAGAELASDPATVLVVAAGAGRGAEPAAAAAESA